MHTSERDVEAHRPSGIPHFQMLLDQGILTEEVLNYSFDGVGTELDPIIVGWIPLDSRNPMFFSQTKKWFLTIPIAMATLAVSFSSSAYSGGAKEIQEEFAVGSLATILGVSLFVLGYAIGPLLWAPLSELYGRQYLFFGTYAAMTAFNVGTVASQNIWTLATLRFFAGAFGSSALTNGGGVIADMFPAHQRGLALVLFAAAPFMGPALGPIIGGFAGQSLGWRWLHGIMAILTGTCWIICSLLVPETYGPVLLRARATKLSKVTGKVHISKLDALEAKPSTTQALKTNLSRPWILLFCEPIVLILTLYMGIINGTFYMLFAAYPIVYQQQRNWSSGIGGLAFLGVMVGMIFAVLYCIWDNRRFNRVPKDVHGRIAPEERLPPVLVGGICLPIALFWFSWTNSKNIHWMVSIAAGAPFGFGTVLVYLGIFNYLIDSYVVYAASVLASNTILRSLFGAVFPLFTSYMYESLGIHWASSIPAFLALVCTPFPFIFYKYGGSIREKCKYAAEAEQYLKQMRGEENEGEEEEEGKVSTEIIERK